MKEQIKNIIESYCEGINHLEFNIADLDKMADEILALQLQQTGVMARCNIDLVGKELEYISPITKAKTKFKVADVFVNILNVGLKERMVYGEVFAISENGNKYKIDEISEVRIPQ